LLRIIDKRNIALKIISKVQPIKASGTGIKTAININNKIAIINKIIRENKVFPIIYPPKLMIFILLRHKPLFSSK